LSAEQLLEMSLQLYQNGKYEECILIAEKAIQVKPDFVEAYNNICAAYNQLGKFKESVEAADKGLAIKPGYQLLINNRNFSIKNEKIK
jgi:tetratricopeptide (TPR) repeat protein